MSTDSQPRTTDRANTNGALVAATTEYLARQPSTDEETELTYRLEEEIFREEGFVNVRELYAKYVEAGLSTLFGLYPQNNPGVPILGQSRMIDSSPDLLPPIFDGGMVITDDPDKWIELAKQGLIDEFATAGIAPEARSNDMIVELIRPGYRHSRTEAEQRGRRPVEYTATILAPPFAQFITARYGFKLTPIGPVQHYMAGTPHEETVWTQPYMFDWQDFDRTMPIADPRFYEWMKTAPMDEHWQRPPRSKHRDIESHVATDADPPAPVRPTAPDTAFPLANTPSTTMGHKTVTPNGNDPVRDPETTSAPTNPRPGRNEGRDITDGFGVVS
jgi:hypothetical protein